MASLAESRWQDLAGQPHDERDAGGDPWPWVIAGTILAVLGCWKWTASDFLSFYSAASRLARGGPDPFAPVDTPDGLVTCLLPPHALLLIAPLTAFPASAAIRFWQVLSAALFAWSVRVIVRRTGWPRPAGWMIAALVWSPTISYTLLAGQFTAALLPVALGVWIGTREERPWLAGVCFGILASVKPFVWPFAVWWGWRRWWRALLASVAGMLVTITAGLLWAGVEGYREWLEALARVSWVNAPINASWFALAQRVPGMSAVTVIGVAVIAACTARAVYTLRQSDHIQLALWLAAILLSPLGWLYYAPWGWGPLFAWLRQHEWPRLAWLLWLHPLVFVPAGDHPLVTITIGSAYVYGMVVLWWRVTVSDDACLRASPAPSERRSRY